MKKYRLIIFLSLSLICIDGCSMIKKFLPDKKRANQDISYELIENLSTAFSEGKLQALEEMIAIYNDTNQPFDVRMASGKALADTKHPTALNALSQIVGDASALDISFMIGSIELLAEFKDDPRAADAMVNAMNNVEEKTNSLQMALVQNLNRVRTKDQVLALLDLWKTFFL
jgi:HEAT repeat protein